MMINGLPLDVELVTPAEFEHRYTIALDCDGMQCENVITVRDENDLITICHELAHVYFPYLTHDLIEWLGYELAKGL